MGAWATYFYYKRPVMGARSDSRLHYAILGIQQELHYNGVDCGEINGHFNAVTKAAVIDFQKLKLLEADGIVGPKTAKALFRKRIRAVQRRYEIPNNYLFGVVSVESNFDPAAVGTVDHDDRGLAQINHRAHPDVTDDLAFNAEYSIKFAGRKLTAGFKQYLDWRCAIASYNAGIAGAYNWCKDNTVNDRLTAYVELVVRESDG